MATQTSGATPAAGAPVPAATKTTAPATAGNPGATPAEPAAPVGAKSRQETIVGWLRGGSPSAPAADPNPDDASPEPGIDPGEPAQGQPAGDPEDGTPPEVPSQPEDHSDDDDGEETPGKQPLPKWVGDRIAKTKAQRDKAKAEAANERQQRQALEAKVAELEAKTKTPAEPSAPVGPAAELDTVTDLAVLRERHEQAQSTVEQVEQLLEDTMDRPEAVLKTLREAGVIKPEEQDWDVPAMRQYLRQVKSGAAAVLKAAPKRAQFLHQESATLDAVLKTEPKLAEESSDIRQAFIKVRDDPRFAAFRRGNPDWPEIALTIAHGGIRRFNTGQHSAPAPAPGAQPKPTLPKVPSLPRAGSRAPAAADASGAEAEQLRQKAVSSGGSREDRVAWIKRGLAGAAS